MKTLKPHDAREILKREHEKDPELRRLYEEEIVNFEVGLAIRAARERKGVTQKELAKKIGTTQSVISRLEDADYEGHSLSILQRIAKALNCRLSIQFKHSGKKSKNPQSAA